MRKPNPLFATGLALGLLGGVFTAEALAKAPFEPSAHRGQVVYQKACASCHGENGDGKGQGAGPLVPKPRDFTTGLYKFRSTPMGEVPTDEDLLRVIDYGIPHTQMPGFKFVLTAQERVDVAEYLKLFSDRFEDAEGVPVVSVPEPPPTSPEFVAEGKMAYMALDCWSCHGPRGKGDGPAGGMLFDAWGERIKPFNLTFDRYKGGEDAASIYRTLHTGLNGTPMSAFGGAFVYGSDRPVNEAALGSVYSQEEIDALKEYLRAQPTQAAIRALPRAERDALTEQRKWAMVHYLRSLQRKPTLIEWLFVRDTEVTH